MSPEESFIAETVRLARLMPCVQAVSYLRGLVLLCGDCDIIAPVRAALMKMAEGDAQLELIASGQLRLDLGRDGNGKDGK